MLRKETVSPELLKVLKALMEIKTLKNHRLVGGTALGLQIGHRISVDIDLFSDKKNDYYAIRDELRRKFRNKLVERMEIYSYMGKGFGFFVNNIKTDIIDWNTKFIMPAITDDGIRIATKEDIIPMKFNTFLCPVEFARYEKKDYTDIAILMKEFSLEQMIDLYKKKYPIKIMSDRMMIEGLQLHELADKKKMPEMLNGIIWADVKKQIERSVLEYSEKRIKNRK